jgi:hypothetical protein
MHLGVVLFISNRKGYMNHQTKLAQPGEGMDGDENGFFINPHIPWLRRETDYIIF